MPSRSSSSRLAEGVIFRVGLEAVELLWRDSLKLDLSLIAREDRRPRARSFLILFSAFRQVKGELLLLIFSLIRFFFSVIPTILSSGVTPAPFTACPRLHLPKIMTKAQAFLNRGGEGRSALGEGEGGLDGDSKLV
ncbi:hypothetical protein NQZ68_001129 [Dissostichus eleginoides]|nr:hypothetical protein NQZ68_001129 [Dissostichus eleginoides]